jgi:hypothetical protein
VAQHHQRLAVRILRGRRFAEPGRNAEHRKKPAETRHGDLFGRPVSVRVAEDGSKAASSSKLRL